MAREPVDGMTPAAKTGRESDGVETGMPLEQARSSAPTPEGPRPAMRPTPIKQRRDFLRASRAQSVATPGFVLQARLRNAAEASAPGGAPDTVARLGLTASKKVGNAVVRNRAKRRLRALAWDVISRVGRPGWDYVLVARVGETVRRDFATMAHELESALERAHDGKGRRQPPRGKGARSKGPRNPKPAPQPKSDGS